MATPAQIGLLVGLVVVAAVHSRSRIAGAIVASVWVTLALVWGALTFQGTGLKSLRFIGIDSPPWMFFAFFGVLLAFNVTVLARAFRRRRSSAGSGTGPSPAGS